MDQKPKVSIIIPCYNEEWHLERNYQEIIHTMATVSYDYELIFVDDGSSDGTREIIKKIAEYHDRVRYIFHGQNRGRGAAVRTGLAAANGDIAGFLDIDLEVHSRYIPAMIQAVEDGADVVCGDRTYKMPLSLYDLFRDFLSLMYTVLVRVFLHIGVKDTEVGYKFFNMKTARKLVEFTHNDGWFWDTEVIATARIRGLNISEIPMVYERNPEKISTVKPIRDSIGYMKALLSFWKSNRTSLTYRSSGIYSAFIRLLYRRSYTERYKAICEVIPEGSSVLDVCCGDAKLYTRYLKEKNVKYTGLDINRNMVKTARAAGVDARLFDIEIRNDLPKADYVVIQGSLYQFIPNHELILRKINEAAIKFVIVAEPVRNMASSSNSALKAIGNRMNNPGTGRKTERFTETTLSEALKLFAAEKRESICGGKEILYVLRPARMN